MTSSQIDCVQFSWRTGHLLITINVELKFGCFGSDHDHLEIRVVNPEKHPLPITSTGYKSLWPINGEYSSAEAAAISVQEWLDESAKNAEWLEYMAELKQPTLF